MLNSETPAEERFLSSADLQVLLDTLIAEGRTVVGPSVDQDAVVYTEIARADQLPLGWTDDQAPGRYRLTESAERRYFGFAVGPQSWKQFLFPPRAVVATADRVSADEVWEMRTPEQEDVRYAFLGVRACELAAIAIQDRVFLEGPYVDPIYESRRRNALIIAVNCTQAASTCFCTSTDTGPKCRTGYDLVLTEIHDGFVISAGSDAGSAILNQLPTGPVTVPQEQLAEEARQRAVDDISRRLDTDGIHDLLMSNLRNERWNETAARCLSCSNCTMVCPTCFCSTVQDVSDLEGNHVDRERHWDSCFNMDFSYMNDSVVRHNTASRYRQWLTHKLASWHDQFGQSGCVGCGRCITWCPPGIDLIEEVAAIRATDVRSPTLPGTES